MKLPMRTTVAAVVAAGFILTQSACTELVAAPAPAATGATTAPAQTPKTTVREKPEVKTSGRSAAADADPVLVGAHQVVILPTDAKKSRSDGPLAVDAKGGFYWGDDGDHDSAMFVLLPVGGGRHQIKVAEVDSAGRESCMALRRNGSGSLTVVAALCDTTRPGQQWTLRKAGKAGDNGRQPYTIDAGGVFLSASGKNLVAKKLASPAAANLTFQFVDNGPSTLVG